MNCPSGRYDCHTGNASLKNVRHLVITGNTCVSVIHASKWGQQPCVGNGVKVKTGIILYFTFKFITYLFTENNYAPTIAFSLLSGKRFKLEAVARFEIKTNLITGMVNQTGIINCVMIAFLQLVRVTVHRRRYQTYDMVEIIDI